MTTNENGKSLSVNVDSLNVRSGPGVDYPVTTQVRMGDALTVQGTSDDWYYVSLPDGSNGWVLSKFTRPL
jgi:N-acetylmuramoyl-L-alanine amidase